MVPFSLLQIDLRQMILALETAIDLVGINDTNHGKRVGYIASQLTHHLGFSEQAVDFSFELGMIHDCGVSTEKMHSNLVNNFDWEGATSHCEKGYRLLKDFVPFEQYAIPVRYHHTPWESLKGLTITRQEAYMANIIFLADRVDALAATHYSSDILLAREEIVSLIESYSGTYFEPSVVTAFLEIEKSEAFWIALEDRHVTRFTWGMGQFANKKPLSLAQLKQLSLIMAYIVDQKSPFTAQHSARVGSLARYLAVTLGLLDEQSEKVEVAGFLHDLGKLRTPDDILDKPGPLNDLERSIMNQHSYETYEILKYVDGLEEISRWAAYHHEGINGTGYPFHPTGKDLSIEARIIGVADVFQALVQDRPYREGMPLGKVLGILDDFVGNGKLDRDVVELAKHNSYKCFEIAKGIGKENMDNELPFIQFES